MVGAVMYAPHAPGSNVISNTNPTLLLLLGLGRRAARKDRPRQQQVRHIVLDPGGYRLAGLLLDGREDEVGQQVAERADRAGSAAIGFGEAELVGQFGHNLHAARPAEHCGAGQGGQRGHRTAGEGGRLAHGQVQTAGRIRPGAVLHHLQVGLRLHKSWIKRGGGHAVLAQLHAHILRESIHRGLAHAIRHIEGIRLATERAHKADERRRHGRVR
mmetsp:Transcript_101/g.334  ORF Transcript_101/g.334 Transcript_101/m.334 type:complete len:215 (-) Transcript_101:552-1196(-)